jgi:hypothetical protein
MKIIHMEGFNADEKRSFRDIIHSNILAAAKALLMQVDKFQLKLNKKIRVRSFVSFGRADVFLAIETCRVLRRHSFCKLTQIFLSSMNRTKQRTTRVPRLSHKCPQVLQRI